MMNKAHYNKKGTKEMVFKHSAAELASGLKMTHGTGY